MKNKSSIFTLLILLFLSKASFAATVYEGNNDTLIECIKKYGLEKNSPVILITINPDENPVYRAQLRDFHDSILKYKITKNVVFVLRSIRQAEAKYFFSQLMNFSPAEDETILCDDQLYAAVNSTSYSQVALFSNGRIVHRYSIQEVRSEFKFNVQYTIQNSLVDSIKLDESLVPISKMNKFIISGSRLFIADNLYNNVTSYDLKTGKMIDHLEIKYDYAGLYKTFLSTDTARIGFACRTRKLTMETFNMPEFFVYNIYLHDSDIYVPCSITYAEWSKARPNDTLFTRYGFLLKTDIQFKKIKYYYFPYPEKFSISDENAFYAESDSTFIYSILPNGPKEVDGNKVLAKFALRKNKIVLKNILPISLPGYFLQKGIGYGYQLSDIYNFRNKNFLYFKLQVPQSYSINDNQVISYPDTSNLDPDAWSDPKKIFITPYIYSINNNTLGYFTNEAGKDYFSVFDVLKSKVLFKEPIPERFLKARVFGDKKSYYLLQPGKEDVYLYHFEIK